jgi:hypothetical protein
MSLNPLLTDFKLKTLQVVTAVTILASSFNIFNRSTFSHKIYKHDYEPGNVRKFFLCDGHCVVLLMLKYSV